MQLFEQTMAHHSMEYYIEVKKNEGDLCELLWNDF